MRCLIAPALAAFALTACGDPAPPDATDAATDAAAAMHDAARADAAAHADAGAAGEWLALAPLGQGARQETGVAALDGRIYVVGGFAGFADVATVEVYDPAIDSWRDAAPIPAALHHANLAAVAGKLYLLGSLRGLSFTAAPAVYVYDGATDSWSEGAPMPTGTERGAAAVGVIGDKIYVAGGYRDGSVADFSAYDTLTGTWQTLPPLPEARDHLVGGAVGTTFFAIGGRTGGIEGLRGQTDAFDLATGVWTARAPIPTARGGAAAAVLDGRIHVAGGEGNPATASGVFAEHDAYDPATDSWSTLAPMRTPRHGTGAAAHDGRLYVPGGADVQAFGAVDTSEVFVP